MSPMTTDGIDWDDAYTNVTYIPDGTSYPERWAAAAADFRANPPDGITTQRDIAYGSRPRNTFDLFSPAHPRGLFVFVHGGYWMRFHKDDWSHLARGALAKGWAVAMPAYTLTPDITITGILDEITTAIVHAGDLVAGPLVLAGHSAGGHLVSMIASRQSKLPAELAVRIRHVISISGLHDLHPLLRTKMNTTLKLSSQEARAISPALHLPRADIAVTAIVGADERPEFIRQSKLLREAWPATGLRVVENRHHFNVIDELAEPGSELLSNAL
jgi:arylformamidase